MPPLPEGVEESLATTKVDYKKVGNSGLYVSVPIVGCMSIGNPEWANWVIGPERALPLLKAAYDRGVTTVRSQISLLRIISNLVSVVGYGQRLLKR